jgi:hypothetical protein
MVANIEIGMEVRYAETFRGIKWVKVGTVVAIGEGKNEGRVQVQWNRWEYESGHIRQDDKKTWVRVEKLK